MKLLRTWIVLLPLKYPRKIQSTWRRKDFTSSKLMALKEKVVVLDLSNWMEPSEVCKKYIGNNPDIVIFVVSIEDLVQKQIDTKDMKCTVKKQERPTWNGWWCNKTVDEDLTSSSFWYTPVWKGAIGVWVKFEMPR